MAVKPYQRLEITSDMELNQLVESLLPFVRREAARLARKLPSHIRLEDLVSAGTVGLMEAVSRFDRNRAASFVGYAMMRIRGSIQDELRRADVMSQGDRTASRKLTHIIDSLVARYARPPTEEEIAAEMDVSVEEYRTQIEKLTQVRILSMDNTDETVQISDTQASPLDELGRSEIRVLLVKALASLSEREQMVLSLYYRDEMTLKEIGATLDLTESRICQIHSQAVHRMRSRMSGVTVTKKKSKKTVSDQASNLDVSAQRDFGSETYA